MDKKQLLNIFIFALDEGALSIGLEKHTYGSISNLQDMKFSRIGISETHGIDSQIKSCLLNWMYSL